MFIFHQISCCLVLLEINQGALDVTLIKRERPNTWNESWLSFIVVTHVRAFTYLERSLRLKQSGIAGFRPQRKQNKQGTQYNQAR